jgi:hypothetical protein
MDFDPRDFDSRDDERHAPTAETPTTTSGRVRKRARATPDVTMRGASAAVLRAVSNRRRITSLSPTKALAFASASWMLATAIVSRATRSPGNRGCLLGRNEKSFATAIASTRCAGHHHAALHERACELAGRVDAPGARTTRQSRRTR